MGFFKSKEEKEFERKVLARSALNKINNHIKILGRAKKYWLDKAVAAKAKGAMQTYSVARTKLQVILKQEAQADVVLARVQTANTTRDFSLLGKDYLARTMSLCENIAGLSGGSDFELAVKQFDLAMSRSEKDMAKLDAYLEMQGEERLQDSDYSGMIDEMISDMLSEDEKEWGDIEGSIDVSDFMANDIDVSDEPEDTDNGDEGDDNVSVPKAPVAPVPSLPKDSVPGTQPDDPVPTPSPAYDKPYERSGSTLKGAAMRPQMLEDYFGQPKAVKLLKEVIVASKKLHQPLGHILLYGGPGLGKTTLANIIANEMNAKCIEINGPAIKQVSDLIVVMRDIEEGDIVFIDEIHRIPKAVSEAIYTAIEDFRLCYFEGSGAQRKNVTKQLPRFTLIGATTDPGLLAKPFKARLTTQIRLNPYDISTIKTIIQNAAKKNGILFPDDLAMELAGRCQETPRLAINYVKRLTNKLVSRDLNTVTAEILEELYEDTGIDSAGLTSEQQELLKALVSKFNGGPIGVDTLASCIGEDKDNVVTVHEPYLKLQGFISVLKQGRFATEKAYRHLGLPIPDSDIYRSFLKESEENTSEGGNE